MSDLVLYRKYRPQKFSEVLGQDHIVDTIQKAISLGNLNSIAKSSKFFR